MSLLIIGSVAFDAIETPFGKTDKIYGGAAMYAALAASYFTDNIRVVANVGDDFDARYEQLFTSHHIDIEGIQRVAGGKSFFWSGRYLNDMNTRETLATDLNVLATFDPVIPEAYQGSEFLLLGNLTPQVQIDVVKRLKQRPKLIVLDTMNFWMNTAMDSLKEVLKMVDVLTINDEEARQLSGEYSLVKAARAILKMGPQYLIVKKGEHGALLFSQEEVFAAPALPLAEVFDPTGAGDCFAGGFIGYLSKVNTVNFNNMRNAVIYGSAIASFCVEKFGPERLLNLPQQEIKARVQQFVQLSTYNL